MTMKRIQMRLSEETLARLDWLAGHLDIQDRSTVIRLAVAELYNQRRLVWLVAREQEQWALVDGAGREVARCTQQIVDRLPLDTRQRLQTEGMSAGSAVGALLLILVALNQEGVKDGVWLTDHCLP